MRWCKRNLERRKGVWGEQWNGSVEKRTAMRRYRHANRYANLEIDKKNVSKGMWLVCWVGVDHLPMLWEMRMDSIYMQKWMDRGVRGLEGTEKKKKCTSRGAWWLSAFTISHEQGIINKLWRWLIQLHTHIDFFVFQISPNNESVQENISSQLQYGWVLRGQTQEVGWLGNKVYWSWKWRRLN